MSEENPPPKPTPTAALQAPARHEPCPHCGNDTLLEPSEALGYRCGVCGKARVPVDLPNFRRSNAEIPLLARASASHTAALAWTAGSAVLAGFSVFSLASLGLVLTALNPGTAPLLFGLLIALMPAGLAAHGFRRARRLRAQVKPAIEEGWLRVAREVVDAEGSINEVRLAEALRVDRERAEQLLVQLAATSPIRHRIEDQAPLSFESPRLRVDPADPADADQQALEALEAAEKAGRQAARKGEP